MKAKRSQIIGVIVLSLVLVIGCTKKEAIQSSATILGAVGGYMLGGDNTGKLLGAAAGGLVGYFVGDWLGDYFTEDEKVSLYGDIEKDLNGLEDEKVAEGTWKSAETPTKTAEIEYSAEIPCEDDIQCRTQAKTAPVVAESKKTPTEPTTVETTKASEPRVCREVTMHVEDAGKSLGSQQQLWCRTVAGDYEPVGNPYSVQTAETTPR
ncbi:MAG: hypothetical protein KKB70_02535 [Proteobacteria bacterium]|nr:hypothetical protein [Pseudomonadota bacterium]